MAKAENIRLDIPVLLNGVEDAKDKCVARLISQLKGRTGINDVHVKEPGDLQPPQLCIHYEPAIISLQRVRELATSSGAALSERFAHLTFGTSTQHARAARRLSDKIAAFKGVVEAEVSTTGSVRIEFDRSIINDTQIRSFLETLDLREDPASTALALDGKGEKSHEGHAHKGGHAHGSAREGGAAEHEHGREGHDHADHGDKEHVHDHGGPFGEKSELIFALLAGLMVFIGWVLQWRNLAPEIVSKGFYIAAYVFGGYYTLKEAIENIRARRFEIDTLMLVAAAGAAALGQLAEGGLLLFLFSLGHSLEHYAMGRARKAIEALAKLAPETAIVLRPDGRTEQVAVGKLAVGDVVLVKPNERLPADGFLVRGQTSVNQAPVTGESVPVDKQPVDDAQVALRSFEKVSAASKVFAGTINGPGAIEVMVARASSESTMARVVKLVTEAQTQRSPTQNFTDKFERIFVPVILLGVVALLFAGFVIDEPFSTTFYRAMAVLVAASPCALAISVPSAVLSGVARAGRSGVLVKGGGPLENLGTLTAIAFDKTGTLTEGKPRLTDVVAAAGSSEQELLTVALAVERQSDHPLASAIVEGAQQRLPAGSAEPAVESLQSIIGRGVAARIAGETVHVGKVALFTEIEGAPLPPEIFRSNDELVEKGRTTMVVRLGARYLGVLGVMDTPRAAAAGVMRSLKELGIQRLIMISGDNQRVAEAVAKSVGLTEAKGDLMPEQKVDAIKALREKEGRVAMVGDGVNDAPAMANATVGIAMGAAGSDVALETADVALMADDLSQLPFAVALSRRTTRVIRQNLWVSLGVVAVLIPATIFGLNIGTAVLFHEGSTLLVVVNALRLLAFADMPGASNGSSQEAVTS